MRVPRPDRKIVADWQHAANEVVFRHVGTPTFSGAARRLQDRVTMGRSAWLCIAISTAALISTKAPGDSQLQASNDAFERGRLIASGGGPGGAAAACFTCHGVNGEGQAVAAIPALAGLSAPYQRKQLKDFASGTRPNDIMSPIAQGLSREDRHAVSVYYARSSGQRPADLTIADADPLLIQQGAVLYAIGAAARDVQACIDCHGPAAQGIDPTYPALAGQPPQYISSQLQLWRDGVRRNDVGNVMRTISLQMSERDIDAVAAYLSVLRRAPRADTPANGSVRGGSAAK
jgi:cytochrome c553